MKKAVCILVVAILLQLSSEVSCQSVIDSTYCEQRGKYCPESSDASYKTKCCLQSSGGIQLIACCNPIVGIYIGTGVTVGIVICIVVALVTTCCCWRCRKRLKSRPLPSEPLPLEQLSQQIGDAPPAYTPVAEGEDGGNLPLYTPDDPFAPSDSIQLVTTHEEAPLLNTN